jgi:hypothetical protein
VVGVSTTNSLVVVVVMGEVGSLSEAVERQWLGVSTLNSRTKKKQPKLNRITRVISLLGF